METNYSKDGPTEEQIARQDEFEKANAKYNEEYKTYSHNVSVIALICAAISLIYEKRIKVLADGILVGGLFTLIYSIIRGFMSEDTKMTFITVSIGLLVVLYLGYHKFVRVAAKKSQLKRLRLFNLNSFGCPHSQKKLRPRQRFCRSYSLVVVLVY